MRRFPEWLKKSVPGADTLRTERIIRDFHLETVCRSARCPNRLECFSSQTATFLILGGICTRSCAFCAVPQGEPSGEVDLTEPERVGKASLELGLKHVVVTSVTRDDMPDGGAEIFRRTILGIRKHVPDAVVEVLTPDFRGHESAILRVAGACPDIFNHNVETVPRLYPKVRPGASYERSLGLMRTVKRFDRGILLKSGLMVGLGETGGEVDQVLRDLRDAGCDVVTIGQYLQPKVEKLPVSEFVTPEAFALYARAGKALGFRKVFSGPFVRSSYHAKEVFEHVQVAS